MFCTAKKCVLKAVSPSTKNIFFYFPLGDGIALNPEKFKRKSFKKTLNIFDLEQTICLQTGVVVRRLAENRVVVCGN